MQEVEVGRRGSQVDLCRMNVHVRDRSVHHHRRIDFENPSIREKTARTGEEQGALLEHRAGGGRPPRSAHLSLASIFPTSIRVPGTNFGNQSSMSGCNSRMTVEPMLNRPISMPLP